METGKGVRIAYICDGEDSKCDKNMCYRQGGPCHHTEDISHALDFNCVAHDDDDERYFQGGLYSKDTVSNSPEVMETIENYLGLALELVEHGLAYNHSNVKLYDKIRDALAWAYYLDDSWL